MLSREQAEDLIKNYGGKVVGSVSKKTDYLLLGENPGSKHTKALQLGIPILSEDELRKLIEGIWAVKHIIRRLGSEFEHSALNESEDCFIATFHEETIIF